MEGKNLKLNWLIQFLVTNVVCNLLSNHSLNLYIWLYGKMYLLLAVYNIQVQKKSCLKTERSVMYTKDTIDNFLWICSITKNFRTLIWWKIYIIMIFLIEEKFTKMKHTVLYVFRHLYKKVLILCFEIFEYQIALTE